MSALLTLAQAAPLVGCRDPRTARKRLAALGVPVVTFDGRHYVDESEVRRALRAHATPLTDGRPPIGQGVQLARGARLWDVRPETEVGPRGGSRRPRGSRERELQAASRAYATPQAPLATSSTSSANRSEEER